MTRVSVDARSGAMRFGAASWAESIERAVSVAGAPPGRRGQHALPDRTRGVLRQRRRSVLGDGAARGAGGGSRVISRPMVQARGADRWLNSLLEGDNLPDAFLPHGLDIRRLSRDESGQKHEGRKDDRRCERLP